VEQLSTASSMRYGFARLPGGPLVAVPVAAALMLAEAEALGRAPFPVIFVHDHLGVRRVAVGFVGVPADVAGAHDRAEAAVAVATSIAAPSAAPAAALPRTLILLLLPCSLPACQQEGGAAVPIHVGKNRKLSTTLRNRLAWMQLLICLRGSTSVRHNQLPEKLRRPFVVPELFFRSRLGRINPLVQSGLFE